MSSFPMFFVLLDQTQPDYLVLPWFHDLPYYAFWLISATFNVFLVAISTPEAEFSVKHLHALAHTRQWQTNTL